MTITPRILVAPLDWGLGHAARCVPIVHELRKAGARPVVASSGRALALLARELPDVPCVELPAYGVRYEGGSMTRNIARQLPRLARAVRNEHHLLRTLVRTEELAGVISDNRFGCFHPGIPCAFVTHQLHIRVPHPALRWGVNLVNHWFIRQFDECWIPDVPASPGLAGVLAHPAPFAHARYIGWLSRLTPRREPLRYDVLFLLSGPEPQRTHLEEILLEEARGLPGRMLLVQGKTEIRERALLAGRIERVSHLTTAGLERALAASRIVVCRPGYSTLMDLARLARPAVLIPTPGQTEQEYLAEQLHRAGYCYRQPQSAVNLREALVRARALPGPAALAAESDGERLANAVAAFLERVRSGK